MLSFETRRTPVLPRIVSIKNSISIAKQFHPKVSVRKLRKVRTQNSL
jgi:hypothetical protein